MNTQVNSDKNNFSIGEVVHMLRQEFGPISISKIRYLDGKGLLKLKRTAGGYRIFNKDDISRLKVILRLQKERYLPLQIIMDIISRPKINYEKTLEKSKEELKEMVVSPKYASAKTKKPLSAVLAEAKISEGKLEEFRSFGFIDIEEDESGKMITDIDQQIIELLKEFEANGIHPKNLKMFENFAEREVDYLVMLVAPYLMSTSPRIKKEGIAKIAELTVLTEKFRTILLKKKLERALEPYKGEEIPEELEETLF